MLKNISKHKKSKQNNSDRLFWLKKLALKLKKNLFEKNAGDQKILLAQRKFLHFLFLLSITYNTARTIATLFGSAFGFCSADCPEIVFTCSI